MKNFLQNIQDKISDNIPEIKYVDEDWGQLDSYSPNPPTQFPFILIDISALNFSDIGMDRNASPMNRQQANGQISLTIANLKLSNTSKRAPQVQKDNVWSIWDLIQKVHEQIHGYKPTGSSGALIRNSLRRIIRDDGIQEYKVIYTVGLNNV